MIGKFFVYVNIIVQIITRIRGGSRVVQVICRNHSNFFPNLFSQVFIAVHEINYPSCFIVYYEIKQRRNYSVDHTANPAPPERIGRVSVLAV